MATGRIKLGAKELSRKSLSSGQLESFFYRVDSRSRTALLRCITDLQNQRRIDFYGGGVVAKTARLKILGPPYFSGANQKVNCFCVKQGQSVAVPTARQHLILQTICAGDVGKTPSEVSVDKLKCADPNARDLAFSYIPTILGQRGYPAHLFQDNFLHKSKT